MAADLLEKKLLSDLRSELSGDVIARGDDSYDDERSIFNAMIDRRPSVIAQCLTSHDVAAAIAFGCRHRLEIAVRGGGHAVSGTSLSDGGLVIDLRRMNAVTVDPRAGTARVGGGALMRDLDRATQRYGLATTGGRVSTTGVGGFTLGGGSGWLERKYGLACDNLLAVKLVTAAGRTIVADEHQHEELFWALHGGGGNFGVVTEFTFRLHSLPEVAIAMLIWPAEAGPEVLRTYRDFIETAPDEVGGAALYFTGPPLEFVPAELVGRLAVGILLTYAGGEAAAGPVFRPMLQLGHAGLMTAELPYAELQCLNDDPPGLRNYWSAEYLDGLPDQALDLFCDRSADLLCPSPSQQVLFPQGGAVARGSGDFPVPWRTAQWVAHPFGIWEDPADDERARRWARALCADLRPWSSGAVYLNFIGDEGEDRVTAGLGAENTRRLAAIKGAYDPENVFHLNHNIAPG